MTIRVAKVKSMHQVDTFGNLPRVRVSGVCQDGVREFAKEDRDLPEDCRGRFAEGIGKLAGNVKGDRRKNDRRTCRKITGGCRSMRDRERCPYDLVAGKCRPLRASRKWSLLLVAL
ncbi:hypothetical protein GW17_00058253 [Ensete ventricosum]|nr:hypothetical protein GW17_00058253 [Ensete ventricosum]